NCIAMSPTHARPAKPSTNRSRCCSQKLMPLIFMLGHSQSDKRTWQVAGAVPCGHHQVDDAPGCPAGGRGTPNARRMELGMNGCIHWRNQIVSMVIERVETGAAP